MYNKWFWLKHLKLYTIVSRFFHEIYILFEEHGTFGMYNHNVECRWYKNVVILYNVPTQSIVIHLKML